MSSIPSSKYRTIVLVGPTGAGKSSLGNLILGDEKFKVGEGSFSETKYTDVKEVTIGDITYRVIDTIGIGDTELSEETVLTRIASVVYDIPKGELFQLLLVFKGKATPETLDAMRILTTNVFDMDILQSTCIVRTESNFFQDDTKCDVEGAKLKSIQKPDYKYIFEKASKLLFIENPSIEGKEGHSLQVAKQYRQKSRDKILKYLEGVTSTYKIHNFEKIKSNVGSYIESFKQKDTELDKKLEMLKKQFELSKLEKEKLILENKTAVVQKQNILLDTERFEKMMAELEKQRLLEKEMHEKNVAAMMRQTDAILNQKTVIHVKRRCSIQ